MPKTKTSKSGLAAVSFEPSVSEVAALAARFLPPLELPDKWQTAHPDTLKDELGKPTDNPYPGLQVKHPEGWRTPWEVLCEEAVGRAKVLLDTAAGITRPAVLAYDAEKVAAKVQSEENARISTRLEEEFDRLVKDVPIPETPVIPPDLEVHRESIEASVRHSRKITLAQALKYALPKVRNDDLRLQYYKWHLEEWRESYNKRHPRNPAGPVPIAEQVARDEFPHIVYNIRAAWAERKRAWQKKVLSDKGREGADKAAERNAADDQRDEPAPAFTAEDEQLLSRADQRKGRQPKSPRRSKPKKDALE